jgi:hypothetical protein
VNAEAGGISRFDQNILDNCLSRDSGEKKTSVLCPKKNLPNPVIADADLGIYDDDFSSM